MPSSVRGVANRRVVPRPSLLILLALYAITSLPWLIVVPPFDASDETAHYDHARYIAFTGHLPDRVPAELNDQGWYTSHWPQPPLYYLLQSRVIRAVGAESISPLSLIASDPATLPVGPSARRLIVHEGGERLATRALLLGRLVSWTLGAGVVLALFAALGAVGASDRTRVIVLAALLLVPAFGGNITAFNNDALAACLSAAAAATLVSFADGRAGPRLLSWCAAGALIGLAFMSKSTTLHLLPMAALTALVAAEPSRRAVALRLCALALGFSLVWSGLWIRNWMVFGDPLASPLSAILLRFNPPPHQWSLLHPELYVAVTRELIAGFFGQFGWSGAGPQSEQTWWVYRAIVIAAVALCATAIVRVAVQGRGTPASVQQSRIAAAGVVCHLLVLYGANATMWAASGRHLLPVLAPIVALLVIGGGVLRSALQRQGLSVVALALPAATVCLMAILWMSAFVDLTMRFRFGG